VGLTIQPVLKPVKATVGDKAAPCPLDQVNRQFHATGAEHAVGVGLHLCRDVVGVRLRWHLVLPMHPLTCCEMLHIGRAHALDAEDELKLSTETMPDTAHAYYGVAFLNRGTPACVRSWGTG
jgi:hypothetical protein